MEHHHSEQHLHHFPPTMTILGFALFFAGVLLLACVA
jgi:hypothetical protein